MSVLCPSASRGRISAPPSPRLTGARALSHSQPGRISAPPSPRLTGVRALSHSQPGENISPAVTWTDRCPCSVPQPAGGGRDRVAAETGRAYRLRARRQSEEYHRHHRHHHHHHHPTAGTLRQGELPAPTNPPPPPPPPPPDCRHTAARRVTVSAHVSKLDPQLTSKSSGFTAVFVRVSW